IFGVSIAERPPAGRRGQRDNHRVAHGDEPRGPPRSPRCAATERGPPTWRAAPVAGSSMCRVLRQVVVGRIVVEAGQVLRRRVLVYPRGERISDGIVVDTGQGFIDLAAGVVEGVVGVVEPVVDGVAGIVETVVDGVAGIVDGVVHAVHAVVDGVAGVVDGVVERVSNTVDSVVPRGRRGYFELVADVIEDGLGCAHVRSDGPHLTDQGRGGVSGRFRHVYQTFLDGVEARGDLLDLVLDGCSVLAAYTLVRLARGQHRHEQGHGQQEREPPLEWTGCRRPIVGVMSVWHVRLLA